MDENMNEMMDEEMEEEMDTNVSAKDLNDEELNAKLTDTFEKIRRQNMLLGARAMCVTIANMIDAAQAAPGKRSMNDMKRIVKKVRDFCQTAIDNPVEEPKFGEETEEANKES